MAGGSSGSSLIDPNQEAVVGVATGMVVPRNGGVLIAMVTPVSKVRALIELYQHPRQKSLNMEHENLLNFLFGPAPKRHF